MPMHAFPITDNDLKKHKGAAEEILRKLRKEKGDLLLILQELTPEEEYRPLPTELDLFYVMRHGLCLYLHFLSLLNERMGLREAKAEADRMGLGTTLPIQQKREFASAYAFFVMASSIVAQCERTLRGKDPAKLANLEVGTFDLTVGRGLTNDLGFTLSYYLKAIEKKTEDGKGLVQTADDTIAVTRDFWKVVAKKAQTIARALPPEYAALVEKSSFIYTGDAGQFSVTGFQAEDRKEIKVVTWAPVKDTEIVGNRDITIMMRRLCDRVAFYDPTIQKNPFAELGALIESILFNGSPGTGKTTEMRMMWTQLAMRAEQVVLPYLVKSMTGDQIKSKWYGDTAQLIGELLRAVQDPFTLALLCVDDIDLLIKGDRNDPSSSGGDLDIMKALMDFFSGTGTNYLGNYLAVAATNKPTGTDDALRQRFVYCVTIKGPETWEDYADLAMLELRKFAKTGLLQVETGGKYDPLKRPLPQKLADIYSAELKMRYGGKKKGTWEDIGRLCKELRQKDPNFTGRPVKNALQVATAQAADFEIPEEWFTDPAKFRAKPWEERLAMAKALFSPLATDMIMLALEHQFEVEQRYQREAHEKRIEDLVAELHIQQEAREKFVQEQN